jgi:hypothetical protein
MILVHLVEEIPGVVPVEEAVHHVFAQRPQKKPTYKPGAAPGEALVIFVDAIITLSLATKQ